MIIQSINEKIYSFIGFAWLFFMLAFPSDFQAIKYVTMIILLLYSFADFILNKKSIHRNVLLGLLIWLSYFLLSLSIGINKGYNVDFSLINIYFVTPIVAVLLSTIVDTEVKLRKLNRYLIMITLIIVSINFLYILDRMSIINIPFDFETTIFGSVFVTDNKLEFRITNQSSLIFLLPYCISLLLTNGVNSKKEKIILGASIFLGLIITIMSGRRAFQAVVFFAFILTPLLRKFSKTSKKVSSRKNRKKLWVYILLSPIVAYIVVLIIEKVTGIDNVILSFWNTFLSAFDFSSGSGSIRADQVRALLTGWSEAPLLGHGINSFDSNLIRSQITPWSYEMVYIALLFQGGILGTIIFFFTTFSIIAKNLKKAYLSHGFNTSYYLSIAVAFTSFFIAGSSNPMVYYVWAWSIALISYQKSNIQFTKSQ